MIQPTLTTELLAELQRGYLAALPNQFDELELRVLAFEKTPSDREIYSNLFQRIHSLKGSAGTYGSHIVTWICHPLEDELTLMDSANPTTKHGSKQRVARTCSNRMWLCQKTPTGPRLSAPSSNMTYSPEADE